MEINDYGEGPVVMLSQEEVEQALAEFVSRNAPHMGPLAQVGFSIKEVQDWDSPHEVASAELYYLEVTR